jgi:catechol 2,3-dioxygenase-like lactoylglutathione lyase family enzyme
MRRSFAYAKLRIPEGLPWVNYTPCVQAIRFEIASPRRAPDANLRPTADWNDPMQSTMTVNDVAASPLTRAALTTMLPVRDLDRARHYYEKVLGLAPDGLRPDGKFVFRCGNGALLALFPKPEGTKAEHTAVSFEVAAIGPAIRALEQRGVTFHDYDLPGFRTVDHVCVLGSEKAAWFSDPEGNILCLHENIA